MHISNLCNFPDIFLIIHITTLDKIITGCVCPKGPRTLILSSHSLSIRIGHKRAQTHHTLQSLPKAPTCHVCSSHLQTPNSVICFHFTHQVGFFLNYHFWCCKMQTHQATGIFGSPRFTKACPRRMRSVTTCHDTR